MSLRKFYMVDLRLLLFCKDVMNGMEQRVLKIVNNCFNTNIYSYLETSVVKVLIDI